MINIKFIYLVHNILYIVINTVFHYFHRYVGFFFITEKQTIKSIMQHVMIYASTNSQDIEVKQYYRYRYFKLLTLILCLDNCVHENPFCVAV